MNNAYKQKAAELLLTPTDLADLSKADTALKGTLETSHRVLGMNLLDFLK